MLVTQHEHVAARGRYFPGIWYLSHMTSAMKSLLLKTQSSMGAIGALRVRVIFSLHNTRKSCWERPQLGRVELHKPPEAATPARSVGRARPTLAAGRWPQVCVCFRAQFCARSPGPHPKTLQEARKIHFFPAFPHDVHVDPLGPLTVRSSV